MADVLIFADTIRSPELRHEVPVAVPDPFLYFERNGSKVAMLSSFEVDRLREVGVEAHPYEAFGWDDLVASGMPREEVDLELAVRAAKEWGVSSAAVPGTFPLELADRLRATGTELTVDRDLFLQRRRVKTDAELAGIRRAQKGADEAMGAARDLLRRAEPKNGSVVLDGEPLTSERLKFEILRVFGEHGLAADEFIVSHGPQSAVGHDMGSGAIVSDESIVIDIWPRDRESMCYADMTRTFVVGTPSDELKEYHRLVYDALQRSLESVRAGVEGRSVFTEVCELFQDAGYPTQLSKQPGQVLDSGFYHGLGHGVGLEVHEQPWLGRAPGSMVAGDVVTLEPGLYRHGYGGCRLEDLALVTEDGCENLTNFPYDLQP
ncbi:MAG: Xaa-Pro peptidase family protein [Thermoleophilaceae bacterium]